jgi:hypothetical protein
LDYNTIGEVRGYELRNTVTSTTSQAYRITENQRIPGNKETLRGEVNKVHSVIAGECSEHVQIKGLSLVQQVSLLLDPQRFDDLQLLRSFYVLDFLDFDVYPPQTGRWSLIFGSYRSVENILHALWITSTMQDTIAPGRDTSLLRGIIFVRAAVVFVRWGKRDWRLCEGMETETMGL